MEKPISRGILGAGESLRGHARGGMTRNAANRPAAGRQQSAPSQNGPEGFFGRSRGNPLNSRNPNTSGTVKLKGWK